LTKLTESAIEDLTIRLFEQLGNSHIHAPDIAPDGKTPERRDYAEVLLSGRLEQTARRINPGCR
jgi:type I restriction enzyme R subunit